MRLFKKSADLHHWLKQQKAKGKTIGFAPTMGALHNGHLSLIEASKKDNSITVSSIFVNPAQFNDPKDFEKYPITLEKDIELLELAGCNVLFLPSVSEIYPGGAPDNEHYNLGYLETILEGKYRSGHFQGVCKVVKRLLDIVQPGNLYLGQKDYQQCMVITKLIELMGWKDSIKVSVCPTLREADGLAMSSRNMRLTKAERENAPAIYRTLGFLKTNLEKGNLLPLKRKALEKLIAERFKPDYIEIADASTLQPIDEWNGKQKLVAVAAAFLNEVRLIDNLLLNE
ncbi:MAG: pantoate--beta-alanine ligase [Chitinophagaceae bacterium]|nr:pantoate--beta-alanine ligase [Chitinophagaceae bacterium]